MTREEIYDAQISPLMAQVLDICKRHQIPMLSDFDLSDEDHEGFKCTSFLIPEEWNPHEGMVRAAAILQPKPRSSLMVTVEHADGSKEVTAFLD